MPSRLFLLVAPCLLLYDPHGIVLELFELNVTPLP